MGNNFDHHAISTTQYVDGQVSADGSWDGCNSDPLTLPIHGYHSSAFISWGPEPTETRTEMVILL